MARSNGEVILLGGRGYIGGAFRAYFDKAGIRCRSVGRSDLDYTDRDTLTSFLREARPRFLVSTAGYSGRPNVDACETHRTEALATNAVLPGTINEACEAAGVPWGHISSGCIFTGDKGTGPDGHLIGFDENDRPNFTFRQDNCSFYSGTKALGEELLAGARQCYIWRLRMPFDEFAGPKNYLAKLMRYDRLVDATNSISHLGESVRACWETFEKECPYGIYHVTNPGAITAREAVAMIVESGVCQKDFSFFEDEAEFLRVAVKASRSTCVLDSAKLARCGIEMTEIHEAVENALRNWVPER